MCYLARVASVGVYDKNFAIAFAFRYAVVGYAVKQLSSVGTYLYVAQTSESP